ncbi:MAG TPA: GMC family oxidoreductase, partial [Ktedonosporobacter sp.]|nr:GMC family oxidoreductase [Ktedonosporobacter sp.]
MPTHSSLTDPDVLIIGAGPTGAVASKRLAEAGFKVVCLEQGDWPDYSKARSPFADFELTAGRDWSWTPNNRRMPSDYPIEESDSDITALMWNGVGGSSVLFAAQWHRNLPSDFRVRSLDGVADDWPLSYADLEPFYQRVEHDFAVSGVSGDPSYPEGITTPLPPTPLGRIGRRVVKAHNKLGWHWWPSSNAIATRAHASLRPCTQRASCLWGCPEGAKASADRSHWPINLELGVQLITGARVQRIEMDAQGRATGATYIDREGRQHFQAAPITILAANGVGTPRLLLTSATDTYRDGLANSSGLVGKRLM